MGKMGRATCIVCGKEFDIDEMESMFIGRRARYRCMGCVENGEKQAKARVSESFCHGLAKEMRMKNKWK